MTVTGNPPSHPEWVVDGVPARKLKSTNPPETEAWSTCAGDDDVHLSDDFIQFHQPEAVHAAIGTQTLKERQTDEISTPVGHEKLIRGGVLPRLQGTDGVDLCNVDNGAHGFEGGAAAFSHLRRQSAG